MFTAEITIPKKKKGGLAAAAFRGLRTLESALRVVGAKRTAERVYAYGCWKASE